MARPRYKLTATQLSKKEPGKYSDGGGLWFHMRPDGGAQWFLRLTIYGKRREMGLGSYPTVSLKVARIAAEKAQSLVRDGKDPIKVRERDRREAEHSLHILRDVALDAFESRKAELKDGGKAGRWFSPLDIHVLPKLGKMPVVEIDQRDIRDTLAPIWHEKGDTARKAMNRLSIVMRHAAALGLNVDIAATDKAKALLGKSRHIAKHIPAMDWRDVPAFYASLEEPTPVNLALRLTILTGLRSKPIRFAHEEQMEGDVWTVPADLMKGREGKTEAFRVPLSSEALQVIALAKQQSRDGFLFPGVRKGVVSDASMARLMERRQLDARPHGFRSSLRVWLSEAADAPRDVAETALGHKVGSDVERAYQRSDHLERRAVLLERWAEHCLGQSGEVLKLAGA